METPIKAAGYVRVSTAMQASEGESLDTQQQQITDFIKQKGWELTNIYSDGGASGSKVEYRIHFQEMLIDAKAKKFNVIVFTKLSRFARNARDYQNNAYELKQYGVELVSIKENIDPTSHTGKMIAGILALIAEWERETIMEQTSENKTVRWRENRTFLGSPPFGYWWNRAVKKLEINQVEADVYLEMVKMVIERGLSTLDVAIELNSRGLIPPKILKDGSKKEKAPWSSVTVWYILRNPCYYGHYVVNKTKYEDGKRGAGTKHTKNPKPESQHISVPIDPLITKTEWDKVQEIINFHKRRPKHTTENTMKSFLRSVVVCGRCGAKMIARPSVKRKDGSVKRYYACQWASASKKQLLQNNKKKCSLKYIEAEKVENEVWVEILIRLALNRKRAFKDLFDPQKYDKRIDELVHFSLNLRSALERLERQRERLYVLLGKPECDVDEVNKKLFDNKDQILGIKAKLDASDDEINEKRKLRDDAKKAADFLINNKERMAELRKEIRHLEDADKNRLVEAMLDGPVLVDYEDPLPGEHGGGVSVSFQTHLNPDILMLLIEEGKIHGLNLNTRQCCYRY